MQKQLLSIRPTKSYDWGYDTATSFGTRPYAVFDPLFTASAARLIALRAALEHGLAQTFK